jgi:hypothetical protein
MPQEEANPSPSATQRRKSLPSAVTFFGEVIHPEAVIGSSSFALGHADVEGFHVLGGLGF